MLNTVELDELELEIGCPLPPDYRKFISTFNGGAPTFPLFNLDNNIHAIHSFLRIKRGHPDDLCSVRNALSDTLDIKRFIPIARTVLGDMICMHLGTGAVSFWDHDQGPGTERFDRLKYIAESFSKFADELYAEEPRDTRDSLHALGKFGRPEELILELTSGRNLISADGYSVGEIAAMHGNLELFKTWIDFGRSAGRSLHIAAKNGRFLIIDYMISCGFDINELDRDGRTPLDVASWDDDYKQGLRRRGARTSSERNSKP
jgi:hypothetical protein